MPSDRLIHFTPFHLDFTNAQLWRGEELLPVRQKPFALLRYLIEHTGQLVSKEELQQAVWPNTYVSPGLIKGYVSDLRAILDDDPKRPQFIETVGRQGYRFIGHVSKAPRASSAERLSPVVGREAELAHLHGVLADALNGRRRLVFVAGEPGIGKTTLINTFVEQVAAEHGLWIGQGQCIEHYGAGEAYLPILDALGRLCREPDGKRLIALLDQYAPTWLVQMPTLIEDAHLETLQRKVHGASRERMLREMAEALEALTTERPLVLVLEDLHWSDYSTLDLLAFLARRKEVARLFVIGTYRPVDVIIQDHPLKTVKQELQLHGECEDVPLGFLSPEAVADYLARRFSDRRGLSITELAETLHRRTEGSPFFMVTVLEEAIAYGAVQENDDQWQLQVGVEELEQGIPGSIRAMIERQIARLNRGQQRVLEVASVAGQEFSVGVVVAGLEQDVVQIEEQCEEIARSTHILSMTGAEQWPEGTPTTRYRFVHALYRDALYERVAVGRRGLLHRRIGECLEIAYAGRVQEIAAELARHFEQGGDIEKAVGYWHQAAEKAITHSANPEAYDLLAKGLALLKTLSDTPARAKQEISLQMALAWALSTMKGEAAPEVEAIYVRTRELSEQLGDRSWLFWSIGGLYGVALAQGKVEAARPLVEQLMSLAEEQQKPRFLMWAHYGHGNVLFWRGELDAALMHLNQALILYDPQLARQERFDPRVICLGMSAHVLWLLGYTDQSLQRAQEALQYAQELSHPYSIAYALFTLTDVHALRRDAVAARSHADQLVAFGQEQALPIYEGAGRFLRGAALLEEGQVEGGLAQMQKGMPSVRAARAGLVSGGIGWLAIAHSQTGQTQEGWRVLEEALATIQENGQRSMEAFLLPFKGDLLLLDARRNRAEAEIYFWQTLEKARNLNAKSVELVAAIRLARLWQKGKKKKEALTVLSGIYSWFTEGFETADLQEAQKLLADFARENEKSLRKSDDC